jgi:arginine utilization regulatory protein
VNDKEKEQFELLKRENQLLKAIIDSIHEGVYATDEKGNIIIYNHQVENTEGMKREEVLGKSEDEMYPGFNFQALITATVTRTGNPLLEQYFGYSLPNGRKVEIISSSFPYYYKEKLAGVYTIGHDVNQVDELIGKTLEIKKKPAYKQNTVIGNSCAKYVLDDIIGISHKMQEATSLAKKVAKLDSPVLIIGETGTGKELFAQGIHNASIFAQGHFVPINCAAIPDTLIESLLFGTVKGAFTGASDVQGLFEQAEDGTIFLDEINSMPLWLQAKLLRVIQDKMVRRIGGATQRPINCRIISAMNVDPFVAIQEKALRSDVFFRLATTTLYVPPLRDRKEDINILCTHFIKKHYAKYGVFMGKVSPELLEDFECYDWPGNVRELQNIIENSMNFVEDKQNQLTKLNLPPYFRERILKLKSNELLKGNNNGTLHDILSNVEKVVIEESLRKMNGNITKTAEELGIFRQALHYRIKKIGINLIPYKTNIN